MNILDDGMSIWDREIALLLRDEIDTRETAERGGAVRWHPGPFGGSPGPP
ncbi:hypothetical protein ACFYNM_35640 [Streptomyces spororaveus]